MKSRPKQLTAMLAVGAGLMMAAPAQAEAQTATGLPSVGQVVDDLTLPRVSPPRLPGISPSPPINWIPKVDPVGALLPR
jgi:hypothetical protein